MEILKNIIINENEPKVFIFHSTQIIPNYSGSEENIVTYIDKALLEPEISEFVNLAILDYIKEGNTFKLLQYQNLSQSFTGYERFWICDNEGNSIEQKLYELSPELIQKIIDFGNKIISVIQSGVLYQ